MEVNKLFFWGDVEADQKNFAVTAQLTSFNFFANGAGHNDYIWGNGFYLKNYEAPNTIGNIQSLSGGDTFTATLYKKSKYETGLKQEYWEEFISKDFKNLIMYCDRSVNLISGSVEAEVKINCTAAQALRVLGAALLAAFGIFFF